MTSDHKRKMAAGRRRWEREQRKLARQRVTAFKKWLANGSPIRSIPPIPSDADYRTAGAA
jgi:hypothetical protein